MITERIIDENDAKNTFHIVKTQDCEAMLNALKELPDHLRHRVDTQDSQKHVGTVPNIVALNWAREWGVRLYSREWLTKANDRLKNDPDWSALRARQTYRY